MANLCETTYRCVGEPEQIKALHKILQKMNRRKKPKHPNGWGGPLVQVDSVLITVLCIKCFLYRFIHVSKIGVTFILTHHSLMGLFYIIHRRDFIFHTHIIIMG